MLKKYTELQGPLNNTLSPRDIKPNNNQYAVAAVVAENIAKNKRIIV